VESGPRARCESYNIIYLKNIIIIIIQLYIFYIEMSECRAWSATRDNIIDIILYIIL
jgi:hypothetical protein